MANMFEFDDGTYVYVEKQGEYLVGGSICNFGIIPEHKILYDDELSYDQNLEVLYYEILDNKIV